MWKEVYEVSWGFFSWYDKRKCRGTTTQDKGFFFNYKQKMQSTVYYLHWRMGHGIAECLPMDHRAKIWRWWYTSIISIYGTHVLTRKYRTVVCGQMWWILGGFGQFPGLWTPPPTVGLCIWADGPWFCDQSFHEQVVLRNGFKISIHYFNLLRFT